MRSRCVALPCTFRRSASNFNPDKMADMRTCLMQSIPNTRRGTRSLNRKSEEEKQSK